MARGSGLKWAGGEHGYIPYIVTDEKVYDAPAGYSHGQAILPPTRREEGLRVYYSPIDNHVQITSHLPSEIGETGKWMNTLYEHLSNQHEEFGLNTRVTFMNRPGHQKFGDVLRASMESQPVLARRPRFRRPPKGGMKVRVREHLKHPPRSCLCHKSKAVDRARRGLVRRLK